MLESISSHKTRSKVLLLVGVCLFSLTQAAFCQPASAQRLIERLRARAQSRYAPPPQAQAQPQAQTQQYPRVLATPSQGQPNYVPGQPSVQSPNGAPTPPIAGQNTSPHFGIEVTASIDGQYQGLQVLGFSPDSKAPAIGLQAGDLIVSINGIRTETLSAVELAQRTIAAGQQSILQIVRDGQLYQAQLPATATPQTGPGSSVPADGAMASTAPGAQASAKPPVSEPSPSRVSGPTLAKPRASLGLVVLDATPQRGVLVSTVREGTVGELAGLQANDRIVSAAGRLIRDTSGLIRELALSNPGDSVKLGIVRGDVPQEIEVEMGGPGGIPTRAAMDDRESVESQPDKPNDTAMPAPKPDSENLPVPSNQSDDGKANTDDPNNETGSGESLLSDPLALPEDEASVDTLPAPKP